MILLTGTTGTIGSATASALRRAGHAFKVAARHPSKTHAKPDETVKLDWDDLDTYLPAMQDIETLFLLTPNSERQVGYMLQAVAAAKRAGVKHIVRLSSINADADPGIILSRQHWTVEREIKASGIPWTMLRPTFFMQNFHGYYGINPETDGEIYLPNGDGKAGWVDADDIGEVAAKVLTSPGYEGKTFELTGPQALSTAEALAVISRELGHTYAYVDVPEHAARKSMEEMGTPLWLVDGLLELNATIRLGMADRLATGVQEVLGREPRSLSDWARSLKLNA